MPVRTASKRIRALCAGGSAAAEQAYNRGVKPPPITITCDCGEYERVPFGERWTCAKCGRRWNTAQIPADEYWQLLRDLRRMRLTVVGAAFGLAAIFVILALVLAPSFFLFIPITITGWFIWYMPRWRRKVRRRARSAPKWQL